MAQLRHAESTAASDQYGVDGAAAMNMLVGHGALARETATDAFAACAVLWRLAPVMPAFVGLYEAPVLLVAVQMVVCVHTLLHEYFLPFAPFLPLSIAATSMPPLVHQELSFQAQLDQAMTAKMA